MSGLPGWHKVYTEDVERGGAGLSFATHHRALLRMAAVGRYHMLTCHAHSNHLELWDLRRSDRCVDRWFTGKWADFAIHGQCIVVVFNTLESARHIFPRL